MPAGRQLLDGASIWNQPMASTGSHRGRDLRWRHIPGTCRWSMSLCESTPSRRLPGCAERARADDGPQVDHQAT